MNKFLITKYVGLIFLIYLLQFLSSKKNPSLIASNILSLVVLLLIVFLILYTSFLCSSELLPPKEIGASCFIHRGYYHIFRKLIKFLEPVFPQSPQTFPISLPDPTMGLSHPYICSLSIPFISS